MSQSLRSHALIPPKGGNQAHAKKGCSPADSHILILTKAHLGNRLSGITVSTGATGAGISQVPRKITVPAKTKIIAMTSNLETFFIYTMPII